MSALAFDVNDAPPPLESIEQTRDRLSIFEYIEGQTSLHVVKVGKSCFVLCPAHSESTPSCAIRPDGRRFYCHGCRAKGDVIDFVMAVEGLTFGEACRRVRELTGGDSVDPAMVERRRLDHELAAAREAVKAKIAIGEVRRILSQTEPLTPDSDPLPVRYLKECRGIERWDPASLRWHPRCPWKTGTTGCIVAAVWNASGEVIAIWRIRPVLDGKVERWALGPMSGGFAPMVDAASSDTLVLAEGIEDALAAWELTGFPAWAALTAGNMEVLDLPAQFTNVMIYGDNDEVGRRAAAILTNRLRAEGRNARVIVSTGHKDPNAVLLAHRERTAS
jgi:phage/plasmid primase-like uncharacterized protein